MHGRVTRYPGISQYLQASGAHIGPTSINSKNWFLRIPGPIIQRSDMFAHRKKKKKKRLQTCQRKKERRILQVKWSDRETDRQRDQC